jgi:two-component system OmpR family sensor kinase
MKLYLRIWLAVVLTITSLVLVVGFVWKNHSEHLREEFRGQMRDQIRTQIQDFQGRELQVFDDKGNVVGSAKPPPPRRTEAELSADPNAQPRRRAYVITLDNGQKLELLLPGRPPFAQRMQGPPPPWYFSPWGFAILLTLLAIAVALGAYPIVRRLTKRLENLQHGVEKWGAGQLSTRVAVEGTDEVAFLAQKFNAAAAQVETLMSSHKSLLANASHELRSPLARIRMALALLQDTPDKASGASSNDTVNEINQNIQELDSLIEEILLASRLDSPEASIGTPESFDLLGLAAEECARTHSELIVEGNTQGTFEMNGYPKLVRRLLRNLLENANRYNQASKGGVTLQLTGQANELVITVQDHGTGVSKDECERIFEPFYRAKNASERDGGVGLGLALVKTIAQRHGGSAVCEDTHGAGGRFVVRLAAGEPHPMSVADTLVSSR